MVLHIEDIKPAGTAYSAYQTGKFLQSGYNSYTLAFPLAQCAKTLLEPKIAMQKINRGKIYHATKDLTALASEQALPVVIHTGHIAVAALKDTDDIHSEFKCSN